jgi:hypothetical protein
MHPIKIIGLLAAALTTPTLAWVSVGQGSGVYPIVKHSAWPAPGTYTLKTKVLGFCGAKEYITFSYKFSKDNCVLVFLSDDESLRVEDPRNLLTRQEQKGQATLAVDGFNRPTVVGWSNE